MVALFPFTTCAQGVGKQLLHGHVPPAVARLHLQPVNRLPATNRLDLAIGLPLRNQDGLTKLLQQIYDPDVSSEDLYVKMLTIFVRGLVAIAQDAATPAPSQTTSPPPG